MKLENRSIQLREHQIAHFKRMVQILTNHPVAFDYSKPGRGKTIISSSISAYYKLPMLIICPAIARSKVWTVEALKYGLNVVDIISFDKLRGQHGKDCSHVYFNRDKDGKFTATDTLRKLLDSGILIVIDEISKLKNQSTGVKYAVHLLIKELILSFPRTTTGSRALLLSAMPCDKPYHFTSLCQLLGLTTHERMYDHNNDSKVYTLLGYKDVVGWCHHINPAKTDQVLSLHNTVNRKSIPIIIMELYDKIIRDTVSSCMPSDFIPPSCIKNGFYALSPEDVKILQNCKYKLIAQTSRISNSDDETSGVNDELDLMTGVVSILQNKGSNWSQVTQTLKLLGKAKLRRTYMLAKDDLDMDPHRKVIIGVWYVDHIMWLAEAFKAYGVQVIYGDVHERDRDTIIEVFQQPNDFCRVLIINPTVVGMCVPLDDQYGNFPRTEIIFPDYRISEIVQTTGRVLRETTKSAERTKIIMMYAHQFEEELRIITTSVNKSVHAKRAIAGKSGLILPHDYEVEHELEYKEPKYPLPNLNMISELDRVPSDTRYSIWT
jgi:hypothetical protein